MSTCLVDFLAGDVEAGYSKEGLKQTIGDSRSEGGKASDVMFVFLDADGGRAISVTSGLQVRRSTQAVGTPDF